MQASYHAQNKRETAVAHLIAEGNAHVAEDSNSDANDIVWVAYSNTSLAPAAGSIQTNFGNGVVVHTADLFARAKTAECRSRAARYAN